MPLWPWLARALHEEQQRSSQQGAHCPDSGAALRHSGHAPEVTGALRGQAVVRREGGAATVQGGVICDAFL